MHRLPTGVGKQPTQARGRPASLQIAATYNLTTGQPLPDVKGGNLAVNFDNSAFHSLFPDAELAIVHIPPNGATPEEAAAHQARMRELVEQGIEIDNELLAKQTWPCHFTPVMI